MHNRVHDLVIDLAVQCMCPGAMGDGTPCVCVGFLMLAIVMGQTGDGNTMVSAHYDNSLESRLVTLQSTTSKFPPI